MSIVSFINEFMWHIFGKTEEEREREMDAFFGIDIAFIKFLFYS